jgi:hypothetical protein
MIDLPKIMGDAYPFDVEKGEDKSFRVSPSRILKCPRGAFMESLGYREPLNVQSDQNFEYGTMRHRVIQRKFREQGLLLDKNGNPYPDEEYIEEELTCDDPPLLAYMDGRIATENGQAVLEIKTTATKPHLIKGPMYTHADQAQIYMHLTGLQEAYLFYESKGTKKGTCPWVQFVVQYDKRKAESLLQKGRSLMSKLDKRFLPMKATDCFCQNPACFSSKIHKEEGLKGFTS